MPVPSRYVHVDDRFARGGMSQARLYRDTHLDRDVVVKHLLPGGDARRLKDEIKALQNIRSPYVVQLYDIFYHENGAVEGIIEELVPGASFGDASLPTSAESYLRLIYPLIKGIQDIHASGRVHRDIKPSNIKFDAEGCLKIFDFGLSRDVVEDAHTVGAVGSMGYMAPELFYDAAGGKVYFTDAVDMYAFGATALYGAIGNLPRRLRRRPPELPCKDADFSGLEIKLPAEVAEILNRCLDQTPSRRPSAIDVAGMVARHLLKDQHRALITYKNQTYALDSRQNVVKLNVSGRGSVDVQYDGLDFTLTNVNGQVYINNIPAISGIKLPGSCVIAPGGDSTAAMRTFITVDVSHPEVTL